MENAKDTVKLLNELIQISEDGEKGFKAAAEKAEDPSLKSLLQDRSKACGTAISELQGLVVKFGGKPETSGTLAGAAHRGWVKVRAAVGDTNTAVLEEVERGEDVAKAVCSRAMRNELPIEVKTVLDRQYQGVLRSHDRVRDLRNQYRSATPH